MCESRKLYIIVEGARGFHLGYWEHRRTNYRLFCSQNQIKYLQDFYRILVDVRVLTDTNKMTKVAFKKVSRFRIFSPHLKSSQFHEPSRSCEC